MKKIWNKASWKIRCLIGLPIILLVLADVWFSMNQLPMAVICAVLGLITLVYGARKFQQAMAQEGINGHGSSN